MPVIWMTECVVFFCCFDNSLDEWEGEGRYCIVVEWLIVILLCVRVYMCVDGEEGCGCVSLCVCVCVCMCVCVCGYIIHVCVRGGRERLCLFVSCAVFIVDYVYVLGVCVVGGRGDAYVCVIATQRAMFFFRKLYTRCVLWTQWCAHCFSSHIWMLIWCLWWKEIVVLSYCFSIYGSISLHV